MDQVMSRGDIEARFESEWVLLQVPETAENLEVLGGKVLWHSKERDEVYRKAIELRPEHSAVLFTGGLPEGMEAVLSAFPSTPKRGWS